MPKGRSINARLHDALIAARRAYDYLGDRSVTDLEADDQLQSGIYWQLVVIGEALNHAVREDRKLENQLDTIRMSISQRNRMIHGYETIDEQVIWQTVRNDLPLLIQQLERLLASRLLPED